MPCYTERTITVDLKAADQTLLVQALEGIGFRVTQLRGELQIFRNGVQGQIRDSQIIVNKKQEAWGNEIQKAYAVAAVRVAAKRSNWQLKQKDIQGDLTFDIHKQRFA